MHVSLLGGAALSTIVARHCYGGYGYGRVTYRGGGAELTVGVLC